VFELAKTRPDEKKGAGGKEEKNKGGRKREMAELPYRNLEEEIAHGKRRKPKIRQPKEPRQRFPNAPKAKKTWKKKRGAGTKKGGGPVLYTGSKLGAQLKKVQGGTGNNMSPNKN